MKFLIGHDDTAYNIESLQKISANKGIGYQKDPNVDSYDIVLSFGARFSDVIIYSIKTKLKKQNLIKKVILVLETVNSLITVGKLAELIQDDLDSL